MSVDAAMDKPVVPPRKKSDVVRSAARICGIFIADMLVNASVPGSGRVRAIMLYSADTKFLGSLFARPPHVPAERERKASAMTTMVCRKVYILEQLSNRQRLLPGLLRDSHATS